jgi:hypothetical protein
VERSCETGGVRVGVERYERRKTARDGLAGRPRGWYPAVQVVADRLSEVVDSRHVGKLAIVGHGGDKVSVTWLPDRSYTSAMADPAPIACTLTTKDAAAQVVEWSDLRTRMTNVVRVENGVEMDFPASLASTVRDLAEREATCCAFLALTTTMRGDHVELRITSDDPDAADVIDLLAGMSEVIDRTL